MSRSTGMPKAPLAPRHWGSWTVAAVFYVAAQLSFKTQYRLGHALGKLVVKFAGRRVAIADLNLKLCFPEMDEVDRVALVERTFRSLGVMAFELASLYFGRQKEIIDNGRVWHAQELQAAVEEGNGVILIGIHQNSMEAAAAIMHANGFQFSCVTRKQKNEVANYIVETRRKRMFGTDNIYSLKDIGLAARHLRKKQINLWIATDQDMGRKSTVWVPFFNVAASTVTTPARIVGAMRDKAPAIVLMSQYRDESEQRVHVKFKRIQDLPVDDLSSAATRLNVLIEEAIRQNPEQYYWVHRRFKTLPHGETRDYRQS